MRIAGITTERDAVQRAAKFTGCAGYWWQVIVFKELVLSVRLVAFLGKAEFAHRQLLQISTGVGEVLGERICSVRDRPPPTSVCTTWRWVLEKLASIVGLLYWGNSLNGLKPSGDCRF